MTNSPTIPWRAKYNLRLPDIGLFSHSLEMGQLEKGVDVYYELTGAIRHLSGVLDKMENKL